MANDDIKRGIEKICKNYPESLLAKFDQKRAYPTDFVNTLTKSGYLSVLIPEKYGGAGLTFKSSICNFRGNS